MADCGCEQRRVLFVGDSKTTADLRAALDAALGEGVIRAATSTNQGLDVLSRETVDCVVVAPPGLERSGVDVLAEIREQDADVPVVLWLPGDDEQSIVRAFRAGASDVVARTEVGAAATELADRVRAAFEREAVDRRHAEMESVRALIKRVNRSLLEAESWAEIEKRVCAAISRSSPYVFAWIGEHDEASRTVRPRVAAGVEDGYLDSIEITTDDSATSRGPTGRAVMERELSVMQDIPSDPAYEPWREAALERGYRSSAAVPLEHGETLYGVLNLYADRVGAFDETERALLEQLAEDVANAIHRAETVARTERLATVIETLPVGVYRVVDEPDGSIVDANPAMADILGAESPAALEGTALSTYLEPTDSAAMLEALSQGQAVRNLEVRCQTKDCRECWITVTSRRAESGDAVYFDGVVQDVTARKRRERAVERLHETARALMEAEDAETVAEVTVEAAEDILDLPATGVHLYDADRDVLEPVAWTDRATEIAGELPTIGPGDGLAWEVFENGSGQVYTDVSRAESRYNPDTSVRSEIILPLNGHGVLLTGSENTEAFDSTDESLARTLAAHATTALSRVERDRQLQIERNRLNALFETVPEPISRVRFVDDEPILLDVNPAFEDTFGVDAEAAIRTSANDHIVPPDHVSDARSLDAAVRSDGFVKREVRRRTVDGVGDFLFRSVPIGDDVPTDEYFGIHVDITELKEYERRLERQTDRLEEFTSTVSHDLRNPLSVANGHLELLAEDCESDHVDRIRRALKRMEAQIEGLLSHAQDGQVAADTLEFQPLEDLVSESWQNVPTKAASFEVEDDVKIRADPDHLKHLLENLIRNAVEHGGDEVTVTVGPLPSGFYLEDDGVGIPTEEREDVFDLDYSTAAEGTGIGLNVVKRVADIHGWTVDVIESEAGGARFEFDGVDTRETP